MPTLIVWTVSFLPLSIITGNAIYLRSLFLNVQAIEMFHFIRRRLLKRRNLNIKKYMDVYHPAITKVVHYPGHSFSKVICLLFYH